MAIAKLIQLMPIKGRLDRLSTTNLVVAILSCAVSATVMQPRHSLAQDASAADVFLKDSSNTQSEQLLLESDELSFDSENSLVIATGNVQIAYGETTLVADRVEYNQLSGRVLAVGNVEILEPSGNRIFANEIDVTDDFSEGFVSALNVQTADNTRIAAESAERRDGNITSFNNGVYTACLPCKENPEKPPFWQIRAKKVTLDDSKDTVSYEDAAFEFFGRPILKLPSFSHASPATKRKSGFLFPAISSSESLGFGYKQGYFFNLAPNYDLTLWGTYFTEQGFLGEAEWRHRLADGEYSIRYAGINQQSPDTFSSNELDFYEDDRQAIITNGKFNLNERWTFGWDALFQTDDNFARTYSLAGKDTHDIVNEVYLRGVGEKNYFDLSLQDFLVQDNVLDQLDAIPGNQSATDQQATVLPVLDYNAVTGEEYDKGQISLDVNVTSIQRDAPQIAYYSATPGDNTRFTGIEGNTSRASAFLEWKGSHITEGGLVATASLNVQGDAIWQDTDNLSTPLNQNDRNPLTSNESIYRVMPAASLEIRYPMIAHSENATHIFEPIGQIIVRPDEEDIGKFANEDSQSMLFDTSLLFRQDKFSGYDRVEGGTRANVGFRYAANFTSGGSLDIVAGQSFHLAGKNSYAAITDTVNAGEESGLETDRSDYVASLQYENGSGFSVGVGARLDEDDFDLRRAEVGAKIIQPNFSLNTNYSYTVAQPNYRFNRDRHEVSGSASLKLDENWRVFGSASYDLVEDVLTRRGIGLAYDNDCFSIAAGYSESDEEYYGNSDNQSFFLSMGLRTIGSVRRDFSFSVFEE